MKQFADGQHGRGVVVIPVVVQPVVVGHPAVFVPVHVPNVEVVVLGVAEMYRVPSVPPLFDYSPSCIVFGIFNAPAPYTKYFHFLSRVQTTLSEALTADTLDLYLPALVARSRNRLHIHLSPSLSYQMKSPARYRG